LQPSSSSFKGKFAAQTDEKSHGKQKAAKETNYPGKIAAAMVVAATVPRGVQWPADSATSRTLSFVCRLAPQVGLPLLK